MVAAAAADLANIVDEIGAIELPGAVREMDPHAFEELERARGQLAASVGAAGQGAKVRRCRLTLSNPC
jgi:hypothetical protein